ncbi:hypothetical protein CsSME_00011165 [Camellia sinensis var. sinensis]
MGLQLVRVILSVVLLLLLLWLTKTSALVTASLAKDGCKAKCGKISIPYPFGIGPNCYFDNWYSVECKNNTKPYLTRIDREVLEISIGEDSYVQFNFPVLSVNCPKSSTTFNSDGSTATDTAWWTSMVDMRNSPFVLSTTANIFMAVGCNNRALMTDLNDSTIAGCVSICNSGTRTSGGGGGDLTNRCFGTKCCQSPIPRLDLQAFKVNLQSVDQARRGVSLQPSSCINALLVDQKWFTAYLTDPFAVQNMSHVPAVLNWDLYLSAEKYTYYKNSSDGFYHALGISPYRTYCYHSGTRTMLPFSNGSSIRFKCSCDSRSQGNPYLPSGCKDMCLYANITTPWCAFQRSKSAFQRSKSRIVIIGVCSGSVGAMLLLIATWWLYKVMKKRIDKKRKEKFFKRNGGFLLQQLSSTDGNVEKTKLFNEKELEKATDHYNEDRILGHGGQGTVYKGMLSDGRIVAVKKSKVLDEGKVEQFINEVVILSQINHRNIVMLLGCCLETEVPLLVYEFISNGTLFQHIHDPNVELPLLWEMRLRIATEVAGALSYLHYAASIPIYHRDIKSTNILLDDKYKAKVSDFGTSRSVAVDQTHLTTLVQGTFGYLDPEYFQSSQFTEKSDVYSFGVVVVELLTGQKAISSTRSQEGRSLATYFIQSMEENRLLDILDPKILKDGRREEIMVVAHLANRCLNLNGKKRPTMKEVVVELEGIKMSQGSMTQQNYVEVEYNKSDLTEAWEIASMSTGTFSGSGTSTTLPFDVQPLLLNKP